VSHPDHQSQILLWDDDALVRQVGRALIDSGLGNGMSMFSPGRAVWSADTVGELYELYNEHLDYGSGTFLGKLQSQIGHGSDNAKLLTAELLTLQALPLLNLRAETKHNRIKEILSWMDEPIQVPAQVDAAFEQSSWNGGQGAHAMIWRWLADVVGFVRLWWHLPEAERMQTLRSPWKWLDILRDTPCMPMVRGAFLYLAFPGYFLPIISLADKNAIRDAYSYRLDHAPDELDHDLYEITLSIQDAEGKFSFYDHPYIDEWRHEVDDQAEKRAWLIRPRPGGQDLVERWRNENSVGVNAEYMGSIVRDTSFPVVRAAVEAGYQHEDYAQRVALATDYWTFISRIKTGDYVAAETNGLVWVGAIGPERAFARSGWLQRPVSWQDFDPTPVAALPEEFQTALEQQGNVADITGVIATLAQILGDDSSITQEPGTSGDVEPAILQLRSATAALARQVHMPQPWLQELIDILGGRRQIVLYGPPGTGKTFLAQEIAHHLTAPEAIRLVQFHPAYSYEDFFEGYRPTEKPDGTAGFALKPGPLRRMATEAARNAGQAYVLIIDEINRANLAKVFGELYFLLEYRRKSIELQYSPEQFSLPRNLFIIGTMNAADRSVAQFDMALRRRFAFIELHPDEPPVRDLLADWIGEADADDRPALLRALNEAMAEEDRDFKIGPAYLMHDDAATPEGLERIWQHDLLPLLESTTTGGWSGRRFMSGSACKLCGPGLPARATRPTPAIAHDRDIPHRGR
jgi:5-methylcytosine-specific restriction enzyme B